MPDSGMLLQWLQQLVTLDVLLQVAAFTLAFALGFLLRGLLVALIGRLGARVANWPLTQRLTWLPRVLATTPRLVYPIAVLLLCNVGVGVLESTGRPTGLLLWLSFFVALWLVQRLLYAAVELRLAPEPAAIWKRQIIRPLVLLVAALHALGLLDNILEFGLSPSEGVLITLRALLVGGTIFYLFVVLSRNARRFLRETLLPRAGVDPALNQVVSTISAYLLLVVGLLIALSTIGIDLTTMTVIAGGLSVGLGFGLQQIVNNFVSGFILLSERSLVPGDVVKVEETVGVVEDVTLRTTQIRTADNIEYLVPNGMLLDNVVVNYTRDSRRIQIQVAAAASYEANPHEVVAALLEAGRHPLVLEDPPPSVLLTAFDDDVMRFELQVWIDQPILVPKISSDIRLQIWDQLSRRQIEMSGEDHVIQVHTTPPTVLGPPAPLLERETGTDSHPYNTSQEG